MRRYLHLPLTKQAVDSRFGLTSIRHRRATNELLASARHTFKNVARILAPSLFTVAFAVVAHAQTQGTTGNINTDAFQNVGKSVITIIEYAGATATVGAILFAAWEWYGQHDKGRAVGALVGALIGGIITGLAVAWGQSLAPAPAAGALQ